MATLPVSQASRTSASASLGARAALEAVVDSVAAASVAASAEPAFAALAAFFFSRRWLFSESMPLPRGRATLAQIRSATAVMPGSAGTGVSASVFAISPAAGVRAGASTLG